jgi:DNA-binding GntR family transcriptional regulator
MSEKSNLLNWMADERKKTEEALVIKIITATQIFIGELSFKDDDFFLLNSVELVNGKMIALEDDKLKPELIKEKKKITASELLRICRSRI